MKIGELRAMTDQELRDRERDLRAKCQDYRFALQSGQLNNSNELSGSQREIARILTVLRERTLQAQQQG